MKWSMRAAILGAGAFVLFVTLSVSIQRWIVYPQFQALETQSIQRSTERLLAAVEREAQNLADFLADYAEWNDAAAYAENQDPLFIESNFTTNSFMRANFQMVWIIAPDGAVIFRASHDSASGAFDLATAEAGERIMEGHPFLKPIAGPPLTGLITMPQGPVLIAAHPILDSEGGGPPRGIMVMGRVLGDSFTQALSEQVQLPIARPPLMSWYSHLKPDIPTHRRLTSGQVETAIQWNDLFGRPALVLTMQTPPDITAVGRRALMQSVLAVLAQGVLFLLIGGLLAHRSMQRSRKEELARLLEERTAALRDIEQYLKTIMDTVPAGIIIVDARARPILDANPAALSLLNAVRADVLGNVCHKFICPNEEGHCPVSDLGRICDRAERVLLRSDGSSIPVLKTVVPTHLRGKDCLLECFVDIRDQKAAEEKIRHTVENMGRMNRAMVGREERVLELKKEVNLLLQELGREIRYREGLNTNTSEGKTI